MMRQCNWGRISLTVVTMLIYSVFRIQKSCEKVRNVSAVLTSFPKIRQL